MLPIPCCEGASLSRNPKSLNLVHLYACICFIKIVLEYWNIYYFNVFYAMRIGVIKAKNCIIPTDQKKRCYLYYTQVAHNSTLVGGKKINLPYICRWKR